MSFEGYYQVRCKNKHYYTQDCYTHSHSAPCIHCGEPTESNMVDETNGESDGFDPDFDKGCDQQIMVFESELTNLKRENAAIKGLLKLILTSRAKPADPVCSFYPSYYTAQHARAAVENDLDIDRCEEFLRSKE